MPPMSPKPDAEITRCADLLAAMGAQPRLRIVRLLLMSHPDGMSAGQIGAELDITASTLSHHLDRLKREGLIRVRRHGTFLWYTTNTEALESLLKFLLAECCTRSGVISVESLTASKAPAERAF